MIFKEAIIFLNNICNFNCYHCYVKKGRKEIAWKDLKYFINECVPRYKIQKISLVGGEPFLYSKLDSLLKELSDKPYLEIFITTNGSIYKKEFIKPLKSINLKFLKISLHSLNPRTFSVFTGTNNQYRKVLDNIDRYSKIFKLAINVTLTKLNYKELDQIIKYCQDRNINFLYISQLTLSGKGKQICNQKLGYDQIAILKKKIKKFHDIVINYNDDLVCSFGKKLSVGPDANFYPCPALISYPQYKIGDIYSLEKELVDKIKKFQKQRTKKCFIEEFLLP